MTAEPSWKITQPNHEGHYEARWHRICAIDERSRMTERETNFIESLAQAVDRLITHSHGTLP